MRSIRDRAAALTATAVLATLALTACGGGEGVQNAAADATAGISAPGNAVATADVTTGGTAAAAGARTPQRSGSGNGGAQPPAAPQQAGGAGSKGSEGGGTGSSSCTAGSVKMTVTKVQRPINHLLLTATNTGGKTCDAFGAPLLRFDQDQSATQINRDSVPQAVVSLSPGQTAYASILEASADGSGTNTRVADKLGVLFQARDGQGSVGSATTLDLPAGTSIDDSATVSYWQSTLELALTLTSVSS
jgi:hypothetical protein